MDTQHLDRFETEIGRFFRGAWRVAGGNPRRLGRLLALARTQLAASRRRRKARRAGIHVPPMLIASVTSTCNLACAGCYDRARHADRAGELPAARLAAVLAEARDLGTSLVLVAGGEPFARPDLETVLASARGTLCAVFTNGLLLDDGRVARLARMRHVVPIVSLEGDEAATDARRGSGVWARTAERCKALIKAGILFGHSITVTAENLRAVTEPAYLGALAARGARVFFFVEYVPVAPGTEHLVLGEAGRIALRERLDAADRGLPALTIAFPGDEEKYGGCLAAGRGFVHVAADGAVEACPFAPFSDSGVAHGTLAAALASPLLARIRADHGMLTENGGCALWANRDWVAGLVEPEAKRA